MSSYTLYCDYTYIKMFWSFANVCFLPPDIFFNTENLKLVALNQLLASKE